MLRTYVVATLAIALLAAPVSFCGAQESKQQDKTEAKAEKQQDEKKDSDKDERSISERMEEAGQLFQKNPDDAIIAVEKIYADYPDDMRIAGALLSLVQQVGMSKVDQGRDKANAYFYKAGAIARKLIKKGDVDPMLREMVGVSFYNEACTYALEKKEDKAYESLGLAFANGFEDLQLASTDSDFGDMLKTEKYKKFLEKQKGLIAERKMAAVKKEMARFKSYDFDFEVDTVEGESISKETYKGKFMIVDIWGTWCPPCRAEVPSFIKLQNKYKDKLMVVGLAYERTEDEDEAIDNVVEFMEETGINYPCAIGTEEIQNQVPEIEGYPTTIFINKEGKVVYQATGLRTLEELDGILQTIFSMK